jgi:hypothetical protein
VFISPFGSAAPARAVTSKDATIALMSLLTNAGKRLAGLCR